MIIKASRTRYGGRREYKYMDIVLECSVLSDRILAEKIIDKKDYEFFSIMNDWYFQISIKQYDVFISTLMREL